MRCQDVVYIKKKYGTNKELLLAKRIVLPSEQIYFARNNSGVS